MAETRHLRATRALVDVQRLRRAEAEARATEAEQAQAVAENAASLADQRTDEASAEWQDHVGGAAHDPIYARWLADRLIGRIGEADQAQARADVSGQLTERRREERQVADGTVRTGERTLKRLVSRAAHDREEKRLSEVGDRITYQWLTS